MSHLNMIIQSELCTNLLSALLHSLWQGLIITGILLLYLKSKATQNANTRYAASLVALFSILVFLFVTWSILNYKPAQPDIDTFTPGTSTQINTTAIQRQIGSTPINHNETQNISTSFTWKLPVISLWLTGVLIMLFRAIYIITGGAKLQLHCKALEDEHILTIIENLRKSLRITRKIYIVISEHISVPGVIGFFKPVLLLPVSMISGIPSEALQAILAHELSHIQRYDYLVNFCQMVIEALLFFNPAVWWISRQIRIEREVCCDNAGIMAVGQRIKYADVLVGWAQQMKDRDMESVEMAIAFGKQNDNSGMLERIKRIVSTDHRPRLKVSWHIAAVTLVLSIATLAGLWQGTNLTIAIAGELSTKSSRVIHFPKEFSIGELFIQDWNFPKDAYGGGIWKHFGYAQNDVVIPEGKALRLDISNNAWQNGNPFEGLKPDDIQMLSFDKNKNADDSVLKDVSNLGGLQVLNLSGTQINGTGFKYLGKLKKLNVLLLAVTYIKDDELKLLIEMPSLEHINFNYTHIGNDGMVYIGKIKTLKSLVLSGTSVDDEGLKHLQNLRSLKYLRLINNHITDKGLEYLAGFTELEDLILQFAPISNEGLAHLSKLKKLKNLYLAGTKVSDEGLKYLKGLKSLEYIDLPQDTHISDEGLSYLSEIKSLKKLYLISDSFTAKGFESLSKLPSLEELDTGGNTEIDDTLIEKIAEFPALKCLWIQNSQVTDKGLIKLKKLKTLKTLKIANSPVTCDGLSVLKEFPGLTELELFNLYKGDAGLSALEGLTSLENLKIYSMQVTDNDLASLPSLTNLKTLYINPETDIKRIEITDKGVQYLGKIKSLKSLLIKKADITDEGLIYLEDLNSLEYLSLTETKVTEEGLIKLKERIPALEYHL